MKLRDFKKYVRQNHAKAVIISDGCRDYVIEVHQPNGAGLLTDRQGRALRFASLAEAKDVVSAATEVELAVRIAADEACAGETLAEGRFATVPLICKAA
jgi:hypothetical protein